MVEFSLLWMSSVWLGWKIIRKFWFTLREDDPDENKESRLNNGKSSGSASQLSFTNLFRIEFIQSGDSLARPIRSQYVLTNGEAHQIKASQEVGSFGCAVSFLGETALACCVWPSGSQAVQSVRCTRDKLIGAESRSNKLQVTSRHLHQTGVAASVHPTGPPTCFPLGAKSVCRFI